MKTRVENINKEIIEWAIIRNGKSLEDFYTRYPKVESWVKGETQPTVKQLEEFTHKVHVPFGYVFLPNPPEESIPMPFFRTAQNTSINKVSLNVYHTIQIIQNRQEWLTEYLDDLDFPVLDFVGRFDAKSNYKTIVDDIRGFLKLEQDWAAKLNNWEEALNYLTDKIEDAGIIVTFNGVVGTNNNRPIEVSECRGFVLVNTRAPFMFINATDAKAAQIFTLIHELAHVCLGESAGFDNQNLLPAKDPIEILCDKVAAELLVPDDSFREKWGVTQDYRVLSKIFKVSPIVIARRALDMNFISLNRFFDFYNEYMAGFERTKAKQKQTPGGNFYATTRKRVSVRFATFVNSAVNEKKLLYRDAYKLTNLKGNTYNTFVTEHLY